jgi:hypothetical protein
MIDPTRPPEIFRAQLRAQGITHALLDARLAPDGAFIGEGPYVAQIERLRRAGCASALAEVPGTAAPSRTMAALGEGEITPRQNLIVRLDTDKCAPL